MPSYIVITNSAGVAYGEGPVYRATRWRATERLDKAGECSFEVPAADPRALALLANKREAHYYTQVNDVPTEVGALIIDKIEAVLQGRAEPMLRVSGGNLLHELAYRTVGGLELFDVETKTATAVSHVWRYGDGTIYSSDLMAEAYDNDHGTVYQIDIGIKSFNYLYVGAATPISACTIDFTNANTGAASTLAAQYFDGAAWQTLTISSDGTHDGTRTFAQDGKITFTRPTNQDKTTHDGVLAYWARLYPSVATSLAIYIAEVDVDQDCETLGGLADIMAYAPPGWTVDDSGDGYAGTKNGAYMQFAGETVLEALTMLAEHTGEHWRLGAGKTIEWLQDDPAVAPVDSGVYAVQHPTTAGCAILELTEARESTQQYSRIYPYGAGSGAGRVTLAYCTETPLDDDYQVFTADNYIVHTPTEAAIGQIEAVRTWAEAGQMEDNAAHSVLASNELYQVALEYLKRQIAVQYAYSVRVADLKDTVRPGETVRVTYQRHRDGTRYVDIDGALVVLGVDLIEDGAGVQTAAFEVATTDSWPMTGVEFLVREIRNSRRRSAGNGASGGPGGGIASDIGLEDLALNSVLLLKQGSAYPGVYSATDVGLAAANAAAVSGDIILLPAAGFTDNYTIASGVELAQLGHNSLVAGTITQNGIRSVPVVQLANKSVLVGPTAGNRTHTGLDNLAIGSAAANALTTGLENIAIGTGALKATTTGYRNVAIGNLAMEDNLDGNRNVAIGVSAALNATYGIRNVAIGAYVAGKWTTTSYNVAVGYAALDDLTDQGENVAVGYNAGTDAHVSLSVMIGATAGSAMGNGGVDTYENVAVGSSAMAAYISGNCSIAIGAYAMNVATGGDYNVAVGYFALKTVDPGGDYNVAIGAYSLEDVSTGIANVALGGGAGQNTITTGQYNTMLGYRAQYHASAGYNASKSIVIGYNAYTTANNTAVIGGAGVDAVDLVIGGPTAASAQVHVDQASDTGAQPALLLDQADVSEEFIRFVGAAHATSLTQSIVPEASVTTTPRAGWLRVYVQDDGNQIADQAYYVPIYTLTPPPVTGTGSVAAQPAAVAGTGTHTPP